MVIDPSGLEKLLLLAIEEDLGAGDITSLATVDALLEGEGFIRAKQHLVAAGTRILQPLWEIVDPEVKVNIAVEDGVRLAPGDTFASLRGRVRSLLAGERTCLNLLCHLCGVATLTARYVAAVGSDKTKIMDTRKTLPGMRLLEKEAVAAGGGYSHRSGLFSQILIKDNHIEACGGISAALNLAHAFDYQGPVEIEVRDLAGLREALAGGVDIILLDNMEIEQIRQCVEEAKGRALTEVSGGVELSMIPALAASGVDRISIGALTHSAPAADLNMKIVRY